MPASSQVLSLRAVNRALLARQLLLDRRPLAGSGWPGARRWCRPSST